jgi:hypothetical protein
MTTETHHPDDEIGGDNNKEGNLIFINGIDGTTGDYLIAPMAERETAQLAIKQPPDRDMVNSLRNAAKKAGEPHLGGAFDVDLEDLTQAGWAIIFHQDEERTVRKALAPLIAHRQKQIGNDEIVKVLEYRHGESVVSWLARHKIAFGPVEPDKVPFYLLLIGGPERIPFSFGHLLDTVYGVGRLHFGSIGGYKRYVESVIGYETEGKVRTSREVAFFGPCHKNDWPTKLSSERLVKPLALGTRDRKGVTERAAQRARIAYRAKLFEPKNSTKESLMNLFRPAAGEKGPCFLFTASHGLGWPNGHADQKKVQGALLCQDFPEVGRGPLKPDHYFAASDLPRDARVHGLVCFHFACFSAGTPGQDRFSYQPGIPPQVLAPQPFFSALPQALLSHENGGALGVIGHVERAWQNSIVTEGAGPQLLPFENAIGFILSGLPLGWALKDFNERFAAQSANLTDVIDKVNLGISVPDRQLAELWLDRNDAEGYVLFGDPAVRLRKDAMK